MPFERVAGLVLAVALAPFNSGAVSDISKTRDFGISRATL
jgi:hypothetical protein